MALPRAIVALLAVPLMHTPSSAAELILFNGNIYTLAAGNPRASAVAIHDGRLACVGSDAEVLEHRTGATQVIDLGGLTVVPGLNDAHMHLAGVGFRELTFDLQGTSGLEELQQKVRERAAATPAGQWIAGRGWIETHWSPAVFPSARDIDAGASAHPVALTRADGHALVANSRALELAGIDASTPDPDGGAILRDAATGNPTGMLIDSAMDLVRKLVPAPSADEVERALVVGAEREAALGWTAIQIAGHSFEESEMVRRLVAEGRIRIRVYDAVSAPGEGMQRMLDGGIVKGESGGHYTRRGVKLYMDGALGSRGAALLAPYADAPGSGLVVQDLAEFGDMLAQALKAGIQVQTHAIGDKANRIVLDQYAAALDSVSREERAVPDPRWRIEHAQVIHSDDIPRFAELGVIASMQPSHAIGDLFFAPSRLGAERLHGAYAWQPLLAAGVVIAAGSDAPVERGEPMIEFYAAVARRALDGFSGEGWHPEHRMTRQQALRAMTLDAAFAAFEEHERGSIEVGKLADLTVLSADIMEIPERDILGTRCVMTIVGGEIVHDARSR